MTTLPQTFDQFRVSLLEFLSEAEINAHFSEALAFYAHGASLAQTAAAIRLMVGFNPEAAK